MKAGQQNRALTAPLQLSLCILQPNCTVCSSRIATSSGGGASKANNVRAYIAFWGASLVTIVWVNGHSVKLPSEHHTKHVLSAFSVKLLFVAGDGSCRDSKLAKVLEKKSDHGVLSPESHNYTSPPRPRGLHRRAIRETGASAAKGCLLVMTWPSPL